MDENSFWDRLSNSVVMKLLYQERIQNFIIALVYVFFVVILLSGNIQFNKVFTLDEVAPHTIQSPVQAHIEDVERTEQLRKEAENAVNKTYVSDEEAKDNSMNMVQSFYRRVNDILVADTMKEEINGTDGVIGESNDISVSASNNQMIEIERILYQYYQNVPGSNSSQAEELSQYLVNTTVEERTQLENLTSYLVGISMSKPITEDFLESTRSVFSEQVTNTGFSENGEKMIALIGAASLQANMIYDEDTTVAAREAARDSVETVVRTIKAGEIIVREGDRITQEQLNILEQLGLQGGTYRPEEYVGLFLMVILTSSILIMMIRRYYPNIYGKRENLYLLALIMSIVLFISRLLMAIQISSVPEIHETAGFLAPVAACSFMVAILIDQRIAFFVNMILTLYLGIMCEEYAVATMGVAFVSGGVSIYMVTHFSRTSDLARSGIYVALMNALIILAFSLIDKNIVYMTALYGVLMGVLNGFLSMILTVGLLPYFEGLFHVTSNIRLLELSDPNTPLLKKLLVQAPGTYHHSLMVGNLAEATADLVHADPVLVRVGAYYHDIGKMKHPEYFVENQQNMVNPHSKIAPMLSSMIIIDHVRSGIHMAKDSDLPPQIIDFVMSHHGTSLTGYFYTQACNEDGKENVKEENYRYDGPKPRSKEVALVMLADSCEAAVRSLSEPTRDEIHSMVHNIIHSKLNDGQLSECELTFHDLDVIEERFCQVLENIYHKRIAYPQAKK